METILTHEQEQALELMREGFKRFDAFGVMLIAKASFKLCPDNEDLKDVVTSWFLHMPKHVKPHGTAVFLKYRTYYTHLDGDRYDADRIRQLRSKARRQIKWTPALRVAEARMADSLEDLIEFFGNAPPKPYKQWSVGATEDEIARRKMEDEPLTEQKPTGAKRQLIITLPADSEVEIKTIT